MNTVISPQRKAKILWRCRRGMLELDLMFEKFTMHHLERLGETDLNTFEKLLQQTDPELYVWLTGQEIPEDKELANIVHTIRSCISY